MKKIKAFLLSLLVAASAIPFSAGNITVSAINTPFDILSDNLFDRTVDYTLWDNFIRYDLCITDYDALTDEQKELCEFIFKTERAAVYTIRCERARRIVAGEDVGERVSLDDLFGAYGIWNKYAYGKVGNFNYIHCIPDIVATDGSNIYNEYWFDDEGKYGVRFKGENYAMYEDWQYFLLCGDYTEDDFVEIWCRENDINDLRYEDFYRIGITNLPDIEYNYNDETGFYEHDYSEYIEHDGNYYYITNDNTAVLIGSDMQKIQLTEDIAPYEQPVEIPAQINGCDVVAIAASAFSHSPMKEIILPDTIKFIEANAFYNCIYLEKINFPEGLEFIGPMAFDSTVNISDIYIDCPDLYISPYAFDWSDDLEQAYINAKIIGENAFRTCENLKQLEFGKDVERIEANAFHNCSSIENLVIPSNVRIIGAGAFSGDTEFGKSGVKSVTISAETEIIGAYAEALGSPNTSGIPVDPVDPLTEEPVCAFDSDCIVYGYEDTEAERYAKEFQLNFSALQKSVITEADADGDGVVKVSDVLKIQKSLINPKMSSIIYDLNSDEKSNVFDLIIAKRIVLCN